MHQRKRLSIKSVIAAGIAVSALLGFAGVTLSAAPAEAAVVYCTYVGYPSGCVARTGVVLGLDRWPALRSVTTPEAMQMEASIVLGRGGNLFAGHEPWRQTASSSS